jgi:biotin synthase-like enzyme
VQQAGISVCSGGILGLGEKDEDRVGLIWEASKFVAVTILIEGAAID